MQNILPQLSHIEEGLNTYGLIKCIRGSRVMWEPVFVPGKDTCIGVIMLIDSFDVEFDSHSQQKREVEGDRFTYSSDFLRVLGENSLCTLSEIIHWF